MHQRLQHQVEGYEVRLHSLLGRLRRERRNSFRRSYSSRQRARFASGWSRNIPGKERLGARPFRQPFLRAKYKAFYNERCLM
jgi:hypothetical protein